MKFSLPIGRAAHCCHPEKQWPTSPQDRGSQSNSKESRTRGRRKPAWKTSWPSPSGATTGCAGAAPRIASRPCPLRPWSPRNRPAFLPKGCPSSGWDFSMTSPGTPHTSWRRRYDHKEAARPSRLRGRSPLALDSTTDPRVPRVPPPTSRVPANETPLSPSTSLVVASKGRASRTVRQWKWRKKMDSN